MTLNLFELTCPELSAELNRRYGKGLYQTAAVYREVFKRGNLLFSTAPEFKNSPALAGVLEADLGLPGCRIAAIQEDSVVKFAVMLSDGNLIESVIIPTRSRATLCLSSQVGCRMGCVFCTTGRMGLLRNLTVEEIVWQVYAARFVLNQKIDNLVFMGMGEPLDNFDNVIQAIQVLTDQRGLDFPLRRITISTAGLVEGLAELSALNMPNLRLAVSLNATDNPLRSRLMPINRRYPLEMLREALAAVPLGRDSVLFIEYVLLKDINDAEEHARALAAYLQGLKVRINLIAYNPGEQAAFCAPLPETIRRFQNRLTAAGLFTRLRPEHGRRIKAACGQLGATLKGGI